MEFVEDKSTLIDQLFGPGNGPKSAIEQYLLSNLSELQPHLEVLSFVIWRYRLAYTNAVAEVSRLKKAHKEAMTNALYYWRSQKQPQSDRIYSLEEAKEMRYIDPTVKDVSLQLSKAERQRDELAAYLEALKVKVTVTPGLQGLWNRIGEEYNGESC